MAIRNFALSCAFSIAMLALSTARADSLWPAVGDDGCAALAAVVFQQVAGSAWANPGGRILPPDSGDAGVKICDQTARTVSAAFTAAMATMNVYVSWRDPRDVRGDVCLSADLSQCYPHGNPFVPLPSGRELAFVYASWSAVQSAAMRYADGGAFSDTSRFSPATLGTDLGRSIRHTSLMPRKRLLR